MHNNKLIKRGLCKISARTCFGSSAPDGWLALIFDLGALEAFRDALAIFFVDVTFLLGFVLTAFVLLTEDFALFFVAAILFNKRPACYSSVCWTRTRFDTSPEKSFTGKTFYQMIK